ncbi:MAG: RHS repeat-associated core domain-containing protein [Chloroflexota bacterium]
MKPRTVCLFERLARLVVLASLLLSQTGWSMGTQAAALPASQDNAALPGLTLPAGTEPPADETIPVTDLEPPLEAFATTDPKELLPDGLQLITPGFDAKSQEQSGLVTESGAALSFLDGQVIVIAEAGTFAEDVQVSLKPISTTIQVDTAITSTVTSKTTWKFELTVTNAKENRPLTHLDHSLQIVMDLRNAEGAIPNGIWSITYPDAEDPSLWHGLPIAVHDPAGLFSARTRQVGVLAVTTEPTQWRYRWNPPVVSTFSGAATFSYPIEVPPGRNGLTPNVDISYSSRGVDGHALSNFDQGPLGLGWSFSQIEISRGDFYVTSNGAKYFQHPDRYSLVLNGESHELKAAPGSDPKLDTVVRYYARNAPQLFVQRIYDPAMPNEGTNGDKIYWIAKTPDGTTYRLGYTWEAETAQWVTGPSHLHALLTTQDHGGGRTGYSGIRWRVDTTTDVFGNQIQYDYARSDESPSCEKYPGSVITTTICTGRSRLTEIRYNYLDRAPNPNTRLAGNYADRVELLSSDSRRVDTINLYHINLATPYRAYEIGLAQMGHNGCLGSSTNTITYIRQRTGASYLPATTMTYALLEHHPSCYKYAYVEGVDNGYGGRTRFSYQHDMRKKRDVYGYSYVVTRAESWDGINPQPSVTDYQYELVCYDQLDGLDSLGGNFPGGSFNCPQREWIDDYSHGSIVGFNKVTAVNYSYTGQVVSKNFTQFHQDRDRSGRPEIVQALDAGGNVLNQTQTTYTVEDYQGTKFTYTSAVVGTVYANGGLDPQGQQHRVEYIYDKQNGVQYGNLTRTVEYNDAGQIYRCTLQGFYPNIGGWIVNKPGYQNVYEGVCDPNTGVRISSTWYSYDGHPAFDTPVGAHGNLTAVRLYTGHPDQFIDTVYSYDDYGNRQSETTFDGYGQRTAYASLNPKTITTTYDPTYHLYPVTVTTHSEPYVTSYQYYGVNDGAHTIGQPVGLLKSVTDANNAETRYLYDIFGRLSKVIRPGDSDNSPALRYDYRDVPTYPNPWLNVPNSGFEADTDWWGWEQSGNNVQTYQYDTSQARSGSRSLKITTTGAANMLNHWISSANVNGWQTGQSYWISAYVKTTSSGQLCLSASYNVTGGESERFCLTASNNWQLVRGKVTLTDATQFTIILRTPQAGTVYVDDVDVQVVTSPLEIGVYTKDAAGSTLWSREVYDGFGRVIQGQSEKNDAQAIVVNSQYDAQGQLIQQTVPVEMTSAAEGRSYLPPDWNALRTRTQYDALGRPVRVVAPDGTAGMTMYNARRTSQVDANGNYRFSVTDEFGRLKRVDETLVRTKDDFDSLDTGRWTLSCPGATPGCQSLDNGTLKSTGTNVPNNYDANFRRSTDHIFTSGFQEQGVKLEFKVDGPNTLAHFALEATGSPYRRFGVVANGNKIYVQYNADGSNWQTPADLINPVEPGVWYVLTLKTSPSGWSYIEVWRKADPSKRGAYLFQMPQGLDYHFRSWINNGNLWMDNYQELAYQNTAYTYDVRNNLRTVTDPLGNVTEMFYNTLGQKRAMHDPDMGNWQYQYDLAGNLIAQIDARQRAINFYYDAFNRLVGKTYASGVDPNTYQRPGIPVYTAETPRYYYDEPGHGASLGKRTRMEDATGSTSWHYDDVRGRMTQEVKTITGVGSFTTGYTYDFMDRVTSITYPTGETVAQAYNAASQLAQLHSVQSGLSYVSGLQYNALGQMRQMTYGNGAVTQYAYYGDGSPAGKPASFRLWNIKTSVNGSDLFNLLYEYDAVGNVEVISDEVTNEYKSYHYDSLNRLTAGTSTAQRYDATGNITSKNLQAYGYNDPAHRHAVTHVGVNPLLLTIRAKGSLAIGAWPRMQVWLNRNLLAEFDVTSEVYSNYTTPVILGTKDELVIAFVNDGGAPGEDRNMWVDRVTIGDDIIEAEDATRVTYDHGNPFDGVDAFPGSETLAWAGGLRFTYGEAAPQFEYDANGNMMKRTENGLTYTQAWDAENRLVSVDAGDQITEFTYDGDGARVLEEKPDGSLTVYVGSLMELSYPGAASTSLPPTPTPTTPPLSPTPTSCGFDGCLGSAVEKSSIETPTTTLQSSETASPTPSATPTLTPTATPTACGEQCAPMLKQMLPIETVIIETVADETTAIPVTPTLMPMATNAPILDDFNRPDGEIGTDWSGGTKYYALSEKSLMAIDSGEENGILWNRSLFGVEQEAFVTLSRVSVEGGEHSLLLKSQSSQTWQEGVIKVAYLSSQQCVQVWTYGGKEAKRGWVQQGIAIPVVIKDGSQFGARILENGQVEVYVNSELIGSVDVTSWPYYRDTGYIGLWSVFAKGTLIDDFGGGELEREPTPLPTTPVPTTPAPTTPVPTTPLPESLILRGAVARQADGQGVSGAELSLYKHEDCNANGTLNVTISNGGIQQPDASSNSVSAPPGTVSAGLSIYHTDGTYVQYVSVLLSYNQWLEQYVGSQSISLPPGSYQAYAKASPSTGTRYSSVSSFAINTQQTTSAAYAANGLDEPAISPVAPLPYNGGVTDTLLGSATSGANGVYAVQVPDVSYNAACVNTLRLVENVPDGASAVSASAPAPATVLDAATIQYPPVASGDYADNNFVVAFEPLILRGTVVSQQPGGQGVGGVELSLYKHEECGPDVTTTLLGSATSGANGAYAVQVPAISYDTACVNTLRLVENVPDGVSAVSASAPAPATVLNAATIQYPPVATGDYADNNFVVASEPLTLRGTVARQQPGGQGVGGAELSLYKHEECGPDVTTTLLGSATSGANGAYAVQVPAVSYDTACVNTLRLVESVPDGVSAVSASAPSPATVLNATTIQYPPVASGDYADNNFVVTLPPDRKVYYFAGGKPVAMRVLPANGSAETVYYLVGDHLGSVSLSLCGSLAGCATADGTVGYQGVVSRARYKPFGTLQTNSTGSSPTSIGFTGQRLDDTGLMYYGARYYSPTLGRFISADSIVPGAADGSGGAAASLGYDKSARLTPLTTDFHGFTGQATQENQAVMRYGSFFLWSSEVRKENPVPSGPLNPQALNRYSYVLNNPLRYTDPTGHDPETMTVEISKDFLDRMINILDWEIFFRNADLLIHTAGGVLISAHLLTIPPIGILVGTIFAADALQRSNSITAIQNLRTALNTAREYLDKHGGTLTVKLSKEVWGLQTKVTLSLVQSELWGEQVLIDDIWSDQMAKYVWYSFKPMPPMGAYLPCSGTSSSIISASGVVGITTLSSCR